jgi:hypothetical protein
MGRQETDASEKGDEWPLCENGHLTSATLGAVLDLAFDHGVQRVVTAAPDVVAGVNSGSALADQDRTRVDSLTVEHLRSEPLCCRIATVLG